MLGMILAASVFFVAILVLVIVGFVVGIKRQMKFNNLINSALENPQAFSNSQNFDFMHQMQHDDAMRMHTMAHNDAMRMHNIAHDNAMNAHHMHHF